MIITLIHVIIINILLLSKAVIPILLPLDGIVDTPRADEIFCLYTAQNFTAATLVGFGRRKDTVECGQLQISNASGATVASHHTGSILNNCNAI